MIYTYRPSSLSRSRLPAGEGPPSAIGGEEGRHSSGTALWRVTLISTFALIALMASACGDKTAPTAAPTPPAGPPSAPYIFSGVFTVAGTPGPAGISVYAQIGNARSPLAATGEGAYRNVILGPANPEDQKGDIKFYLLKQGAGTVQAAETYPFQFLAQPRSVDLSLTFASLP